MRTAMKLILLLADDGVSFDMLINFATDDASPIANPYVGEIGELVTVQTDGSLAVTGSELVFTAQSTPVWGDLGGYIAAGFTREPGRTLFVVMNLSTWEEAGIGWDAVAAVPDLSASEHSLYAHATDGQLSTETIANILSGLSLSTDYKMAIMLRTTGAFTFVHDGNAWLLVAVNDVGATATLYPALSVLDGAGNFPTFRSDLLGSGLQPSPVLSDSFSLIPTIADSGADALDGTPVRVGLDGSAGFFNSAGGHIQLPASSIDAAGFDPNRFGVAIRAQVNSSDDWSDVVARGLFNLGADASNFIDLRSPTGANTLFVRHVGGGTTTQIGVTTSPTTLFGLGMSVDIDAGATGELKAFSDGAKTGATGTSLGTFVNSLVDSLSVVGALSPSTNYWLGIAKELVFTLNGVVPTEAQFNFITDTAETITDSYLDTQFGAGNWAWYDMSEQYASDGLGHLEADGSGAGKTRNGGTFHSVGSKRYNGAVGGADLLTNGDFITWSADDPASWTVTGEVGADPEVTERDSGQSNADTKTTGGSANLYNSATAHEPSISQASVMTVGKYYRSPLSVSALSIAGGIRNFGITSPNDVFIQTTGNHVVVGLAIATTLEWSAWGTNRDVTIDENSLHELTLLELLDTVETGTAQVLLRAKLTIPNYTMGGFGVAWDSISNPQNGLNVYIQRHGGINKLIIHKFLSGSYSAALLSVSLTYSAGALLEVLLHDSDTDGTYDISVIYNGTFIGSATFSDAAIIGNTIHGLFGLTDGGYAEDEQILASNKGTLYDRYFVGA